MTLATLLKIPQPSNRPLIAVPITLGPNDKFGPVQAALQDQNPDLVEWRADYIADAFSQEVIWQQVKEGARQKLEAESLSALSEATLLGKLDEARQEFLTNWPAINAQLIKELVKSIFDEFGHFPIVLTYRSKAQGGQGELDSQAIAHFLIDALGCGFPFAAVDVEDTLPANLKEQVIATAKAHQVPVILSYHDFKQTPPDLVALLTEMSEEAVDVVKLAVMPQSEADVDRLLAATKEVSAAIKQPLITMAMGKLGERSRIEGYRYGSQLTFATLKGNWSSAPGQLTMEQLLQAWR
ncbi:type I 3-dehydroquinate dehydratase [Lactobacillaceae bacterium L1_55_11]|nr:type I 3-dehydroquinate dehydratase [Lactobacillaceae bacterium L1_55_11]